MPKATTKTKKPAEQPSEEKEKTIGLFDVLDMIQTKRIPWSELDERTGLFL